MRVIQVTLAVALAAGTATSASAFPVLVKINQGLSGSYTFVTDSSDVTVKSYPDPDPTLGGTDVEIHSEISGPYPPPPADMGLSSLPVGNYQYYAQYDISFGLNFAVTDTYNFVASGSQISLGLFDSRVLSLDYDVGPGGVVTNDDLTDPDIDPIFVQSFQISTVPLPASAPLFGFAVLALAVVGYGMKQKTKAAA